MSTTLLLKVELMRGNKIMEFIKIIFLRALARNLFCARARACLDLALVLIVFHLPAPEKKKKEKEEKRENPYSCFFGMSKRLYSEATFDMSKKSRISNRAFSSFFFILRELGTFNQGFI